VNRLQTSFVVGILCAFLLTMIRGGWRDAPMVVPFFAISGFSITYIIAYIIQSEHIATIERSFARYPNVSVFRDLSALVLVAVSFVWSGQIIQGAGFGGWLVALFLGVVFPLGVCLLASHWLIVFGLLAATSLAISTLLHHPNFREGVFARDPWEYLWQHDLGVWLFIWGILACLSLLVSVPLAARRRMSVRHGGRPQHKL
jgi:hypothetical protein